LLRDRRTGTPACPTGRPAQPLQPAPNAAEPAHTGKSACATDEYPDLLRLLDEEITFLEKEFQYAENLNKEQAAAERDACLAPDCQQWKILVRREGALDRANDPKVRILLAMRKEFLKPKPPDEYWNAGTPEEQAEINRMIWGDDNPSHFPSEDTMSQVAGLPQPTPSLAPPQPPKINERTENVYENKG